jgi:hypothetical protein
MAVLDTADPFAAFERALRHPLATLAAAGELKRNLLVVIDGLDELTLGGRATSSPTYSPFSAIEHHRSCASWSRRGQDQPPTSSTPHRASVSMRIHPQ